jgi:putative flippase GtrA
MTIADKVRSTFLDPTDRTSVQFVRAIFVGAAAFSVDVGTLWALTGLGHVHYLVSAACGFVLGLAVNYVLSTGWVFNRRTLDSRTMEFAVFALIGLVGLGLTELLMWLLTDIGGLFYLVSKIVTTVVVYSWNFGARKRLLFR